MKSLLKQVSPYGIVEWRNSIMRERQMVRFYSQLIQPNDLVFDVGANFGSRISCFRTIGARVVAFEPQPSCFGKLQKRFGYDRNVILENCGIAEKVGKLTLHTSSESVLASFSREFIADSKKVGRFRSSQWDATTEADVSTLDIQIEKYGEPQFIKIDIEGFEPEALLGLTRSVSALSFEWTPEQFSNLKTCVCRCMDLGMRFFNMSFAESFVMNFPCFVPGEKILEICELLRGNVSLFGDVYCCCTIPPQMNCTDTKF